MQLSHLSLFERINGLTASTALMVREDGDYPNGRPFLSYME